MVSMTMIITFFSYGPHDVDKALLPGVGQAEQPYCLGKGEMMSPRRKPMPIQMARACPGKTTIN
jgi:hypothetical protein